jgi:hypothetical protein
MTNYEVFEVGVAPKGCYPFHLNQKLYCVAFRGREGFPYVREIARAVGTLEGVLMSDYLATGGDMRPMYFVMPGTDMRAYYARKRDAERAVAALNARTRLCSLEVGKRYGFDMTSLAAAVIGDMSDTLEYSEATERGMRLDALPYKEHYFLYGAGSGDGREVRVADFGTATGVVTSIDFETDTVRVDFGVDGAGRALVASLSSYEARSCLSPVEGEG